MDGAMGTELQRAGIGENECYELWNLTRPEKVLAIHQAYVDAGAEVLLTNTFQANPVQLARKKVREHLRSIMQNGCKLARSAGSPRPWVVADIGPFGDPLPASWRDWMPEMPPFSCFPDGFLFETFSNAEVLDRVLGYWHGSQLTPLTGQAYLASVTYRRYADGTLLSADHNEPEFFAAWSKSHYMFALGVNCGRDIGMDEVIEIVRRYRTVTDLPLFARPNAGTPSRAGNEWVYPLTPEEMARRLPELLEAGVSMVGGCCGTTPAHIAAMRPVIDDWNERHAPR
jgi:methionine synthase I (cobalamin-dependent)